MAAVIATHLFSYSLHQRDRNLSMSVSMVTIRNESVNAGAKSAGAGAVNAPMSLMKNSLVGQSNTYFQLVKVTLVRE